MTAKGFHRHDHASCIADAIEQAESYCAAKGLKFTDQRRRVLRYLLEDHRALGAYDILDRLRADGLNAQPPVAYRALEFLVTNGFAHRIERLNAFIACAHPEAPHAPAFLICRKCHAVAETETDPVDGRLGALAETEGFTIEATVLEAEGVCPNCAGTSGA
ncbi:transcriptional repressor [Alphaproteobacteria bacterium GH1-50]|uniref:Transcriptional repressor n=1 Tax=Kangsaoukella pontilimi TaxID=2691042 RepID=A0A7C9MAV7_9RHOB|nr:transcriptional repressor [Kangsaoukella pontilimi]MXQ06431.1 transcriptional repressor [Kangsaoukella pontilimi]